MKKKCFVAKYFENFGIRQIKDILLVVGMIALIVALCLSNYYNASIITLICASVLLAGGFGIGLATHIITVVKTSKHLPEYKHSITNIVISAIGVAITLFAFIYALIEVSPY